MNGKESIQTNIVKGVGLPVLCLVCLFLVQCSNDSGFQHIRILEEIPQDILEVENLSILPGDPEPAYSMELIPEQTFGERGEPYLSRVWNCVVDDKGRVIILNFDMSGGSSFPFLHSLYVYNPDGTFHTQIGGSGRGPGEFGLLTSIHATADSIYALDHTGRRMNVYNTNNYTFERSTLMERWSVHDHETVEGFEFTGFLTRNDGNHLPVFREMVFDSGRRVYKALLMDTDGNALNFQPLVYPAGITFRVNTNPPSPSISLSFMGGTITALSDEDAFYTAWTQDFLIHKYDADGTYQSAIYYPIKGSPFDLDEYTEGSRYTRSDVIDALENSGEELPESNPVLADLMVDDENRIWAAIPADAEREIYEWWVLDPSGELLATLVRPRDQRIEEIKNGYLYSSELDEETGAEFVVKYRIELTPRSTASELNAGISEIHAEYSKRRQGKKS